MIEYAALPFKVSSIISFSSYSSDDFFLPV